MTPEDLAQITAAIAAGEQRITAAVEHRITAAIAAAEQRITAAVEQRITDRLDRAVEAIGNDFSELRQEFKQLLEPLATRLDTLERRFDNFLPILVSVDQRMSALVRQSDRLERDNGAMLTNDAAQQRAFDALAARVAKLEQRAFPPEQQ